MDMQLICKTRTESEMAYFDSLPRDIRTVINEYGEWPFANETANKLRARCELWERTRQEYRLTEML
jgi:hypothetical protein